MTFVDQVRWHDAHLWWLLLVPLALVPLFFARERFRRRIERSFSGRGLLPSMVEGASTGRRVAVFVLTVVALEAFAVAALRPRYGLREEVVRGSGVDIAIVLDASRSMKAADVAPDRLTAATVEVSRLLDRTRGDRVTLVPFSGIAFVQTPLTLDHEVIKEYLRGLKASDIPVPGTAIGRALGVAKQALQLAGEERKGSANKAIVLLTDGENFEGEPAKVADELASAGVRIFAVGVGTPSGQPIPILDESGQVVGTAREKDGVTPVLSKLNEDLLKDLANRTRGRYFSLSGGEDVASALAAEIATLEKAEYQAQVDRLLEDRFQYPLGAGLLALVVALLLAGGARQARKAAAGVVAVALAVSSPASANPFDKDHGGVADALAMLAAGQAGDAAKALADLESELGQRPDLLYDLALARDRQGEYAAAVEAADRALSAIRSAKERPGSWPTEARVLHAKGTILMHQAAADSAAKKDPREVRATWRRAVDALSEALLLAPEAEDSRRNLELAAGAAWPPCSKLDDPHEPNDIPGQAKFLEPDPNTGEARADLLLCPDQEDWFKVPLRSSETLFVSVEEPSAAGATPGGGPPGGGEEAARPAAVDATLLGGDGDGVLDGPGKQVRRRAAGAEVVFIRVTGPKEEDGVPYVLDARLVPPCPAGDDAMEPNDAREAPKPLPDGDHGLRVCAGNEDWFTYTEKQGTRKVIVLEVPRGEGPLEMEVWSADGAPLDVRADSGEGGEARVASLPKAEQDAPFTVRVFGGGQEGFYKLSVKDDQGQGQDQQQRQDQQQQQRQEPEKGSRTMRELLDSIDRNDENLEAKEALRTSPYREWVPEKDW